MLTHTHINLLGNIYHPQINEDPEHSTFLVETNLPAPYLVGSCRVYVNFGEGAQDFSEIVCKRYT